MEKFLKGSIKSTPTMNPPIWANQAVALAVVKALFQICKTIQKSSRTIAGMRAIVQKNPRNINVLILAKGNKIRYAPNIPDIAPLAPTIGILESSSVVICPNAASVPQRK